MGPKLSALLQSLRLTVISTEIKPRCGQPQRHLRLRCHCGKEFDVWGKQITSHHTKSCGCLRRIHHRNYKSYTHRKQAMYEAEAAKVHRDTAAWLASLAKPKS